MTGSGDGDGGDAARMIAEKWLSRRGYPAHPTRFNLFVFSFLVEGVAGVNSFDEVTDEEVYIECVFVACSGDDTYLRRQRGAQSIDGIHEQNREKPLIRDVGLVEKVNRFHQQFS